MMYNIISNLCIDSLVVKYFVANEVIQVRFLVSAKLFYSKCARVV